MKIHKYRNTYCADSRIRIRMARKLEEEEDPTRGSADKDVSNSKQKLVGFSRRGCMRAGAAIAAAVAALGVTGTTAANDNASETERELEIIGTGDLVAYEVTVDGSIAASPRDGPGAGKRVSGSSAEGVVAAGRRRYQITGDLGYVAVGGDVNVQVDGSRVAPEAIVRV